MDPLVLLMMIDIVIDIGVVRVGAVGIDVWVGVSVGIGLNVGFYVGVCYGFGANVHIGTGTAVSVFERV